MADISKVGFWSSKTKGQKTGIIVGSLVLLTGIALTVRHFFFKKETDKAKTPPVQPNVDTTTTATNVKENQPHVQSENLVLPNSGVGCSETITTYDRDFDYVKCNGVWYTKSKSNPSTPSAKDKFKDWFSLEKNEVATKLLNTRYPGIK